jgi:hypothetical protein
MNLTTAQQAAIENAVVDVEYHIRRREQRLGHEVSAEKRVPRRDRRDRMTTERNILATYYCHREELYGMLQKPALAANIHQCLLDGSDLLPIWLELQNQRDNNPDDPDAGRLV